MTQKIKLLTMALVLWLSLSAGLLIVLFLHRVPTSVTLADRMAIARFIALGHLSRLPGGATPYDRQIAFIAAVQGAMLKIVPGNRAIPLDMCREPADILRLRTGLCYDRSRLLEKIFRSYGFPVRHASLYTLSDENSSVLAVLMKPGAASHAVTEVRTEKGWLLVDSNAEFLSLDAKGFPVSLANMAKDTDSRQVIYHPHYVSSLNPFYRKPFAIIYGLYSRHGRFYPPFDRIPNIAWDEFRDNF